MIKVSNRTPVLVVLFIISSIAGLIYSPWGDFYDKVNNDIPPFIMKLVIIVFAPLEGELISFVECLLPFYDDISTPYAFAITLKIPIYVIIVHMIEKYHSEMHNTEEIYTICVDIHCIEGIAMYLLNISFHILGKILETSKNDDVFEILIVIACIIVVPMSFFMVFYIIAGIIITLLFPCLLGLLLSFLGGIGMIIGFIGGIVVGRIIWAKCSDKIYSWLLDIEISNVEIFKIPKKILSLVDDFDLFS